MVVKKLEINGFRNLKGFAVDLTAAKNLIYGANGSGKTSVIEALYFLGFGKSFLPVQRRELVHFGGAGFFLKAGIVDKSGENTITAHLEKGLALQLNEERSSLSQVGRHLYPLFFSHFLYSQVIDGAPHLRRLIDRFIYGLSSLYLHDVLRYNQVLQQKNYLLKNLGRAINNSELRGWNTLLAETGSKLVNRRMAFTNQLNGALEKQCRDVMRLHYHPALFSDRPFSETALLDDLDRARTAEIRSRRSLIGPQRDRFEVAVNERKLQLFSSGEKKKYLLMMYLAYIGLFQRARGEYPVFLLDDYDAVMDERNLEFVLDHFPAMQVIATSVEANERFERCIELKKE